MKKILITLYVCATVLGAASCAFQLTPKPKPERILYHNYIDSVVVVPFINVAQGEGNVDATTEIFSTELGRFSEINIVHPFLVERYLYENQITLTEENIRIEALRIAAFFNVQSAIIGTVTEYNAFYPPVFGLSIELIDVETGKTIATKSETYDSSFNYIREELRTYASVKKIDDSLYQEELILRRFDLYIRFVCHQLIQKYF